MPIKKGCAAIMIIALGFMLCNININAAPDDSIVGVYTSESVSGYWEGDYNIIANCLFTASNEFVTDNHVVEAINSFVPASGYEDYARFITFDGNYITIALIPSGIVGVVLSYTDISNPVASAHFVGDVNISSFPAYYCLVGESIVSDWNWSVTSIAGVNSSVPMSDLYKTSGSYNKILYSELPLVTMYEAIENGASAQYEQDIYCYENSGVMIDLSESPLWNGSEIVIPGDGDQIGGETINNHLFAKTFDIGFCMNPNLWNGNATLKQANYGNFYFKYDLDNFALMNVSDLSLYVNASVVSPEGNFTDSYSFPLDGDGFITYGNNFLVSNYTWLSDPSLFTVIYDYDLPEGFKKMMYYSGLTFEKYDNSFGSRASGSGRTARVYYNSTGERIGAANFPDLTIYPDDFRVTFDCYIFSKSTNEQSKHYIKSFNFVTGAEVVGDNGIIDNENPYEGESDYNDVIPWENGGSVSGMGRVIQQVSFPERILLEDGAYLKVAELYKQDALTVQSGFWAMLGYFDQNPMIDTYGEMFGFLPDEFETYILMCIGVCFGFAVFRAIRGRC